MKLPEQPLSLCAYCAMPLDLGAESASETGESPNAGRIARISEHDSYADAMAWSPPEGPDYWDAIRVAWRGRSLIATGAVVAVIGALTRSTETSLLGSVWLWVGLAVAGYGGWLSYRGAALKRSAVSIPLLKRAGLITDRRSETQIKTLAGSTTYYFTIEFEGGVMGEFRFPGRGSQEDPYPTNLPGVAFTRGPVLIAFKHIRV